MSIANRTKVSRQCLDSLVAVLGALFFTTCVSQSVAKNSHVMLRLLEVFATVGATGWAGTTLYRNRGVAKGLAQIAILDDIEMEVIANELDRHAQHRLAAAQGFPVSFASNDQAVAVDVSVEDTIDMELPDSDTHTERHELGVRGGNFNSPTYVPSLSRRDKEPKQKRSQTTKLLSDGKEHAWMRSLLNPSALLIFGGDGSGKSTFAQEMRKRRLKAGHDITVLDPHGKRSKWPGCKVIGSGLNYDAITAEITKFREEVKLRHKAVADDLAEEGDFEHYTLVCEEMTNWATNVAGAAELLKNIGDYRKVNCHLLIVSHGDCMGQLGNVKGFAKTLSTCLTKLELLSKPGEDGDPIPAGLGRLKPVGSESWLNVNIPKLDLEELAAEQAEEKANLRRSRTANPKQTRNPIESDRTPLSAAAFGDSRIGLVMELLASHGTAYAPVVSERLAHAGESGVRVADVMELFEELSQVYPDMFQIDTEQVNGISVDCLVPLCDVSAWAN